jgi:hypothetical protein
MAYKAKNNAFSTLASSMTNVTTTLIVQTGHGDRFPVIVAPDLTYITLEDISGNREIVKVTDRPAASDTLTVVRAQEGTTALSWAAGSIVELRITAGLLEEVINEIDDHIADPTDAHDASAISSVPSGNLAATNVQAALNELDTEKEKSIHAATAKTTPVDADTFGLIDSADSNTIKKVTWANIKATLLAYFDTVYANAAAVVAALALKANLASPALTGTPTAPTAAPATNTTQIATTAFVIANAPEAFPSGTRMPFNQTAAPTGWTKDTTAALNDSIMRIVTGTVSSGGSTAFSTFNGQSSVGATTLSIAQMPSHNHTTSVATNTSTAGGGTRLTGSGTGDSTASTGGGGSHTHTITTSIKYNDFIIASKN